MICWSYGGGVQSTAITCLVVSGRLPRPDLIIMADTGREPQATWDYLRNSVAPLLNGIGLKVEIAPHSLATVDLFSKSGKALMPMFTRYSGKPGQTRTWCSGEWKRDVVKRYLRSRGVRRTEQWLGISCDEAHRMKDSRVKWITHVYPLINLNLRRMDCLRLIHESGLPPAPRSSCWMCPFRGPKEWADLPDGEFRKAQDLEAEIRILDPSLTLLRSGELLTRENACGSASSGIGCDQGGFCWT